jgi:hypothetical protein
MQRPIKASICWIVSCFARAKLSSYGASVASVARASLVNGNNLGESHSDSRSLKHNIDVDSR